MVFQGPLPPSPAGLIVGGFAERMKFSAVLLFAVIWFTFAYIPMAHMVWYWAGPDAYTDAAAAGRPVPPRAICSSMAPLDFAGGTVVHINNGGCRSGRCLHGRQAGRVMAGIP